MDKGNMDELKEFSENLFKKWKANKLDQIHDFQMDRLLELHKRSWRSEREILQFA